MAAFADVQAALEQRLAAMGSPLPTAWEGVAYTPIQGTAYQRVAMLPATVQAAGVGTSALNRHDGIFQVSLFYPSGKGPGAALAQADAVAAQFKRGTSLTQGTTTVVCQAVSRGPVLPSEPWLQVPVSVQFFAHAAN